MYLKSEKNKRIKQFILIFSLNVIIHKFKDKIALSIL